MKITRIIVIIISLTFIVTRARCQSNFGLWNTFSIEKEFTKKFSAGLDEEVRLKDNLSHVNLFYTNLGVSYRPFQGLKLSLTYRFTQKYVLDNEFNFRNRLMFDASYKYRLSNLSFTYRSRIQSEIINNKSTNPEWFWRSKFEVKYNIKKISPYLGAELRYQIKVPKHPETDLGWHRVRLFAGVDYKINENNTVGIYYLRQNEFYILDPNNLDILGLQYSLTLPHKKN
jgi:hypothetical protein